MSQAVKAHEPHLRSPVASRRTHVNNGNGVRVRRATPSPNSERVPLVRMNQPPIAGIESDNDLDDNREVVTKPYPGVDDGLFDTNKPKEEGNPDVEIINTNNADPETPEEPSDNPETDLVPTIFSRAGGDGDSVKPDDVAGASGKPETNPAEGGDHPNRHFNGRFPYAPGFGTDLEIGSVMPGDLESIPDVNVYQHKKTLAQGMMDLALFSANANQLRYVLESSRGHPYFYPSVVLISISLLFQVAVGCGLIWNATYNVKDDKEICVANKINNFTVIGIFLVTVINVFISAFGVAAPAAAPV